MTLGTITQLIASDAMTNVVSATAKLLITAQRSHGQPALRFPRHYRESGD
jgi:hypothetical protein